MAMVGVSRRLCRQISGSGAVPGVSIQIAESDG